MLVSRWILLESQPSISYVAVDGAQSSGDYLKHVKACVENTGGSFPDAGFLAAHGAAISVPAARNMVDMM